MVRQWKYCNCTSSKEDICHVHFCPSSQKCNDIYLLIKSCILNCLEMLTRLYIKNAGNGLPYIH